MNINIKPKLKIINYPDSSLPPTKVENPKSQSLRLKKSSNKRFSGLRSL